MARTPEGAALTQAHSARQVGIRNASLRDILGLYAVVNPTNLAETIGPFASAAALIALAHRRSSVAVSERYWQGFRVVEHVKGGAAFVRARHPELDEAESTLRGATLAGIINGRKRGFSIGAAHRNGFVYLAGSLTGLVLGGGRGSLIESITGDREAEGWQRVTSGHACAFCSMLASRGAVYKSEESSEFQAHSHCTCSAEPFYPGSKLLPANAGYRATWNRVTRGLSGDRAMEAYREAIDESLKDRARESVSQNLYDSQQSEEQQQQQNGASERLT